jgi:hypothetical protein
VLVLQAVPLVPATELYAAAVVAGLVATAQRCVLVESKTNPLTRTKEDNLISLVLHFSHFLTIFTIESSDSLDLAVQSSDLIFFSTSIYHLIWKTFCFR